MMLIANCANRHRFEKNFSKYDQNNYYVFQQIWYIFGWQIKLKSFISAENNGLKTKHEILIQNEIWTF